MNKTFQEQGYASGLCLYHGLFADALFSALSVWRAQENDPALRTAFLRELYEANAQDDLLGYVSSLILYDDNPFTRACASGIAPSQHLVRSALADFSLLRKLLAFHGDDCVSLGKNTLAGNLDKATVDSLAKFHRENGYGDFLRYTAFRYADGKLVPISSASSVRLSDLKGFDREKREVKDNFENFILGLPYADMLLYGDRGTGKSSTVHATVNEFATKKLRLVELNKEELLSLPRLKTYLAKIPMKFVVFIDDFSLSEEDERFSTLKASLQGTMEGCADNVMIVATSNRRHIVEENFDTRHNSVHAGDSEQELLSLSDRFGVTVLFSAVSKKEYLFIVQELAKDMQLKTEIPILEALAEGWALAKGGRSPRRAKQFIGFAYACEQKGVPIEF